MPPVRRARIDATLLVSAALAASATAGCSKDAGSPSPAPSSTAPAVAPDIDYPAWGSTSAPSGKGSFRFGVSSAATQIEDMNTTTDWWLWTSPKPAGLANDTFVDNANMGYTKALDDIELITAMHLQSYRLSMEWARIEPVRGQINEAALEHYDAVINALVKAGIHPMITLHHFSNPVWVDDPRDPNCTNGPSDTNLCGWNHPTGGPMVAQALADHATLLAKRYGDRVDDWCTVNEPINYLVGAYGVGYLPPGKKGLFDPLLAPLIAAARNYIAAHALVYKAIKAADVIDADGDGVAASVGFTHGVAEWVASRDNKLSTNPVDVAAQGRLVWLYHYLFVEAVRQGKFDSKFSGALDEDHPEWKGTLDWLGVQYYFRAGVTGNNGLLPVLDVTPCVSGFNFGSCVPPLDPSYLVPAMNYEHDPAGLYDVLDDFGKRWPDLPMTVTESGIATLNGTRRAEVLVRALEQIERARNAGIDVRGYYHWSVADNFEWASGFVPRFGLYSVNYTTYARTPTAAAGVYGQIAGGHKLSSAMRAEYGGSGPLTAESAAP